MKKINTVLIGNGYWGSKLAKYIEENPAFDLLYICNSKSDLNEVWNDKNVSTVVVAVPNVERFCVVHDALIHHKNVFTEKPLALSLYECELLNNMAMHRNLLLAVDYTWTFSEGLKKAQDIVKRGEIGSLLGIEMVVKHLGRFKSGNVYWLLGSHMLSVLDMFVPLQDLSFEKRDLVVYDGSAETGVILFHNENISGQIVVSLNYPGKETKVTLYGEDGTIFYNPLKTADPSLRVDCYERLKWKDASELPQSHKWWCIDEGNNLQYAIEYLALALEGKEKSNVGTAIEITRILEAFE